MLESDFESDFFYFEFSLKKLEMMTQVKAGKSTHHKRLKAYLDSAHVTLNYFGSLLLKISIC